MPRAVRVLLLAIALGLPAGAHAQTTLDAALAARIRQEADGRSEILRTLHILTDVYGPRLTGSPGLKAAGDWAVERLRMWGLTNGRLEPWEFGRPGWVNERVSAHIVAPVKDQLVTEVVAWTPGTHGVVRARAFHLRPPDRPTPEALDRFLASMRPHVQKRIVLVGQHVVPPIAFDPPSKRRDDDQVRRQFDPDTVPATPGGGARPEPPPMTAAEINRRIDEFLVAGGARLRVNGSRREHGQIVAFGNMTFDVAKVLPTVVMRNEDYGRIVRILAGGTSVELEFDIVNTVHPEGRTAYNAIAEIEGTDKWDEIVMMGGHLDAWHSATGATDNAIGCATIMEAARILKAAGVRPRRTIRVALWSGEEQGLLGSQAYVARHFGSFENPQREYGKLVAYVNMDSGTGRIRGATVFGPPAAAAVLRAALAPFADLGVVGAIATRNRNVGGTDSTSFNHAGLPSINFIQDPIEYGSHTHHTNLDTYERILEADAKGAAVVIAATVYELAMREEALPRFSAGDMPEPARRWEGRR